MGIIILGILSAAGLLVWLIVSFANAEMADDERLRAKYKLHQEMFNKIPVLIDKTRHIKVLRPEIKHEAPKKIA